jgi:hypothetical protein
MEKKGDGSFVVEASPFDADEFNFIRIAHLHKDVNHNNDPVSSIQENLESSGAVFRGPSPPENCLWAGVFGCCPEDNQGCSIQFNSFSVLRGSNFVHSAGNQ